MDQDMQQYLDKADVLIEALTYIQVSTVRSSL